MVRSTAGSRSTSCHRCSDVAASATPMASLRGLAARALLRRDRPNDELAAPGGAERRPGLSDRSGNERFDLGTGQHLDGLDPNEPGLVAGSQEDLLRIG